jgi:hypothetical protein
MLERVTGQLLDERRAESFPIVVTEVQNLIPIRRRLGHVEGCLTFGSVMFIECTSYTHPQQRENK